VPDEPSSSFFHHRLGGNVEGELLEAGRAGIGAVVGLDQWLA
jgi:hypothetical protein